VPEELWFNSQQRRLFLLHSVHTGSGTQANYCSVNAGGSFLEGIPVRAWSWPLSSMPTLRTCGTIPPLPQYVLMVCIGTTFPFTLRIITFLDHPLSCTVRKKSTYQEPFQWFKAFLPHLKYLLSIYNWIDFKQQHNSVAMWYVLHKLQYFFSTTFWT
jgi:hypothetical protein